MKKIFTLLILALFLISFISAENHEDLGTFDIESGDSYSGDYFDIDSFSISQTNLYGGDDMYDVIRFDIGDSHYILEEGERVWWTDNLDEGYKIRIKVLDIDYDDGEARIKVQDANDDKILQECSDAGYVCRDAGCSYGEERIDDYDCGSPLGRPQFCCKETVLDVDSEVYLNKYSYQKGEWINVGATLPYFADDCTFIFIDPSGREEIYQEGGGCGQGESFGVGDAEYLIKNIFNEYPVQTGIYTVKVIAKKQGFDDIIVTKNFEYNAPDALIIKPCSISGGKGICQFLGVNYSFERRTNYDENGNLIDSDYYVKYMGREKLLKKPYLFGAAGFDSGVVETDIGNNIKIENLQSPLAVDLFNLRFKKTIVPSCSDGVCEVGESYEGCAEDCNVDNDIESSLPDSELECYVGCLNGYYCLAQGALVDGDYCNQENGIFYEPRLIKDACTEDYECESKQCDGNYCTGGFFHKIRDWFRRIFR